jgi:hypothetical protein
MLTLIPFHVYTEMVIILVFFKKLVLSIILSENIVSVQDTDMQSFK